MHFDKFSTFQIIFTHFKTFFAFFFIYLTKFQFIFVSFVHFCMFWYISNISQFFFFTFLEHFNSLWYTFHIMVHIGRWFRITVFHFTYFGTIWGVSISFVHIGCFLIYSVVLRQISCIFVLMCRLISHI